MADDAIGIFDQGRIEPKATPPKLDHHAEELRCWHKSFSTKDLGLDEEMDDIRSLPCLCASACLQSRQSA